MNIRFQKNGQKKMNIFENGQKKMNILKMVSKQKVGKR